MHLYFFHHTQTIELTKLELKGVLESTKEKEEALKTLIDTNQGESKLDKDQLLREVAIVAVTITTAVTLWLLIKAR